MMEYTTLCNLALPTSPKSLLVLSLSLTVLQFFCSWNIIILVLGQLHVLAAPRFPGLPYLDTLQLKHCLFTEVFANIQYQLAPRPMTLPSHHLSLHPVLFHL